MLVLPPPVEVELDEENDPEEDVVVVELDVELVVELVPELVPELVLPDVVLVVEPGNVVGCDVMSLMVNALVPETIPSFAVIFATPAWTPVTTPADDTVATDESLDDQVGVVHLPEIGSPKIFLAEACIVTLPPTGSVSVFGVTFTDVSMNMR